MSEMSYDDDDDEDIFVLAFIENMSCKNILARSQVRDYNIEFKDFQII